VNEKIPATAAPSPPTPRSKRLRKTSSLRSISGLSNSLSHIDTKSSTLSPNNIVILETPEVGNPDAKQTTIEEKANSGGGQLEKTTS